MQRVTLSVLAGGALALLTAGVCSCDDSHEEGGAYPGRSIGFKVEALGMPAGETPPETRVFALQDSLTGGGTPLYLHATVREGMVTDGENALAGDVTTGGVSVTESRPATKAAPVDASTMHASMGVSAFVYPAAEAWNDTRTPDYMYDTEVKKAGGWTTDNRWPGAGSKIRFFAYAPYRSALPASSLALSAKSAGGAPVLTYTVPADVAGQTDLLTAATDEMPGGGGTPALLTFKHALTAVRFVTGNDLPAGTITNVTLKGVYGKGTYRIGESAWEGHADRKDFTQALTPAATIPESQTPGTEITPAAATFMMIPQQLPAGAELEVKYTDRLTNAVRTMKASIAGSQWEMGKTVTYQVSVTSMVITPTLEVTAPAEYDYQGGSDSYTVKSYATVSGGGVDKVVPIPWEVEFSEDGIVWNKNKPAWLTAFTENGEGGTEPTNHTAGVAPQVSTTPDTHNKALKNAAQVAGYDLSTKGGTAPMRTANCYIVNAPGTYRLPLVYGNAVDYVKVPGGANPGWNTSAYTSTVSGADVLNPFINHLGNGITDPYIYNNTGCVPASCTLIWQDEPNLVTDVALSSDGHFLTFTVNQATIHQGNAVVAVRDASNTVLWSWHIWVTDYRPGTGDKTITNYQDKQYTIMPYALGWCDGKEEIYAERTVQVRFKQRPTAGYTSAAEQTITVKQKAHTIAELGNNTFYQWGRKDPFVGGLKVSKNKTWYDADGNEQINKNPPVANFSTGNACITTGIENPGTYCISYGMDQTYLNLWSADNNLTTANDNAVVKTVYDPCPVGYKQPPSNGFTGFTTTGTNSNESQLNVNGEWNEGWNFYCGKNKTGDTVFFPASGYRLYNNGGVWCEGVYGVYWSAVPLRIEDGRALILHPSYVYQEPGGSHYYYRNRGFSVWPFQE
ncbi:fimbrillin family protein [Bacteroides heparinolyticus]|uniref:Fimbrillin family protein n=1 Tax=Prevotella heparinolytica TaxID=28113 RepID=A0A3P2A1H3_9BACE|nr:fimbrillin family protein [Bacteroides heparinolyticus]RRD89274.1 fimbrillin family protein [Bacteroides heparinolyticus]